MPEITRRRTGELLRKLFEILTTYPEGLKAGDALRRLELQCPPTHFEAGNFSSGGRRYEKIVRFATVDTVKAGWLAKEKGTWLLTDAGRQAFEQYVDPEAFYRRAIQLYRDWKNSRPGEPVASANSESLESETAKEVRITFERAEEQAWEEIRAYIGAMPPYDFQKLVASLLRAMDYHVQWIAPPGRDGGTDILASSDPLGTRPPRIKVQVKRQQQVVGVESLRSFLAVLGDDDVGLFVCTGGFSREAADEARTQERRKITLLDLEQLFDLWVEHYPKLGDEARGRLPLRPIYFLSPSE